MRLIIFVLSLTGSYAKVLLTEELIALNSTNQNVQKDLPTYYKPLNTSQNLEQKCDSANDISGELDCPEDKKINNGTALILTPYIENGRLEDARKASEVNSELFFGVKSYSGFFTVNKTFDSNSFFWYFPVEEKQVNETPWIVWLQGGPGVSSLVGLFEEIGPVRINKFGVIERNPYAWTQNYSLLFIDNPIGTGYSFTNHPAGYVSDMATYSKHLLSTVEQFLQVFPELRATPLFIAGESYAGKYVPALGAELHRAKTSGILDVNLEGFLISNALIEPSMIKNVNRQFFYFGLINKEELNFIEPFMKSFREDIDAHNSVAAKDKWMIIVTLLLSLSNQQQAYNFLKDELAIGRYVNVLESSEVKRGIHVGDIKYSFLNVTVNEKMAPDFLSSSKELFEELLENGYRVLSYWCIYTIEDKTICYRGKCLEFLVAQSLQPRSGIAVRGHLDQLLPCFASAETHRTLNWKDKQQFIDSKKHPFFYQGKLAGHCKIGGNLTEAVVRGAGHMVPADQPGRGQYLVTNWISKKSEALGTKPKKPF